MQAQVAPAPAAAAPAPALARSSSRDVVDASVSKLTVDEFNRKVSFTMFAPKTEKVKKELMASVGVGRATVGGGEIEIAALIVRCRPDNQVRGSAPSEPRWGCAPNPPPSPA